VLTFIYPTARGLFPMKGNSLSQYDLLAQCLAEQRYTDVEVIICDKENVLPRPEIELACRRFQGGVRFIRPRMTPWTKMGAFAPNAARNSALCWARGQTIAGVDDAYSFGPYYFERIAALAAEGQYTVSKLSQADNSVAYPDRPNGTFPVDAYGGGIISYPLAAAVAVNGWDERMDGGSGGDVDFFARLRLHGVEFWTDADVTVVGHGHGARTLAHPRCERLSWSLAQQRHREHRLRANEPWMAEELQAWRTCGRQNEPRVCSLTGFPCDYKEAEPGNVTAIRERHETMEWFSLAEERAKLGPLTPASR
jgi:hypothetical protein